MESMAMGEVFRLLLFLAICQILKFLKYISIKYKNIAINLAWIHLAKSRADLKAAGPLVYTAFK